VDDLEGSSGLSPGASNLIGVLWIPMSTDMNLVFILFVDGASVTLATNMNLVFGHFVNGAFM
jgi:hypothetical protein